MMSSPKRLIPMLICLLISACSGLAGEPRIVAVLPTATIAATEIGHPVNAPDMATGAAIFVERCSSCHGVGGAGDGELVQRGQVVNAGNFTLPETAQNQRPTGWHATITNGRIENLMPPWRDALTEQARWDVGMYAYTLHYTPDQLAHGREVYALHCSQCHGDSGVGDGRRAIEFGGDVKNLTSQNVLSILSDTTIYNVITEGVGMPDVGMPGFADELSEAERWAVTAYTRTLSLSNVDRIGQPIAQAVVQAVVQVTDESGQTNLSAAEAGTISGRVTNASLGGSVPPGLQVTLFAFDPALDVPGQFTVTADADGRYAFDDIALNPAAQYVTSALYRDRVFTSGLIAPSPDVDRIELPLILYELTEDPAVVEVAGVVTQVSVVGENLEVAQVFSFRNTSDRAFSTSEATENGRAISVVVSLPPGSLVAGFSDNQQRYVVLPEQYLVVDTAPVLPGEEHIVQVVYYIPYSEGAIIEQPINYALNGPVRVLLNPPTAQIRSEQFAFLGEETIGATTYQSYGGDLALAEGSVIRYEVGGSGAARLSDSIPTSSLPVLVIVVVAVEGALLVGLVLWMRQRRNVSRAAAAPISSAVTTESADGDSEIKTLIRLIADLDAQHERGEIDDNGYQTQRAALKSRLADLMTR